MFMKKTFVLGDMSEVLRGFEGKWVALSIKDGQVVISGSGVTITEAVEKARESGVDDPTLIRAPEESCAYII
jgi:hypothetical protein